MPRKSKKNQEKEQNPVENTTPVNENPTPEVEPVVTPEVEATVEEVKDTEPVAEVTDVVVEQTPAQLFQSGLEEPKAEEPKAEVKKALSQKEMFEKAIETRPFTIFQNGILVCHHSDFVKITVTEKYFEINFRKFSYEGIEIKYI